MDFFCYFNFGISEQRRAEYNGYSNDLTVPSSPIYIKSCELILKKKFILKFILYSILMMKICYHYLKMLCAIDPKNKRIQF